MNAYPLGERPNVVYFRSGRKIHVCGRCGGTGHNARSHVGDTIVATPRQRQHPVREDSPLRAARQERNAVPRGCDARWATWAAPIAEALRGRMKWDDALAVGAVLGFSRPKTDNILCWLENEGLACEAGGVAGLTFRGRRFLDAHQTLGACDCFVCRDAARWRRMIDK